MSPVKNTIVTLSCVLSFALCGCTYGPNPYGGYGGNPYGTPYQGGYQQYPGYGVPTQTLQPGQQYIPGGSVTPQGVYPGGTTPTYQNNNGGLQPIPNNGASSDAPPYSSTEINKPVPDPSSPAGGPFYNNSNTSTFQPPIDARDIQPATHQQEPIQSINNHLRESNAATSVTSPTESYSPPANAFPESQPMNNAIDINSANEIPAVAPGNSFPPAGEIPPVNSGADPFKSPVPSPSINSTPPAMPAFDNISNIRTQKPVLGETKVFAHDSNYAWLRGVVSHDKPTDTWSIVYSDNPSTEDKYAGHLSFATSPFLSNMKEGEIVEVQGEIDPIIKDPLGKPLYLVTQLKRISGAPVATK